MGLFTLVYCFKAGSHGPDPPASMPQVLGIQECVNIFSISLKFSVVKDMAKHSFPFPTPGQRIARAGYPASAAQVWTTYQASRLFSLYLEAEIHSTLIPPPPVAPSLLLTL